MPILEPDLSWTGRVHILMLTSALLSCTACAPFPTLTVSDQSVPSFWADAMEADESERVVMLESARAQDDSWKIAMLRSLPGPEHLDDATTLSALETLLQSGLSPNRAALARLRTAELSRVSACHAEAADVRKEVNGLRGEVDSLRAKVRQVADIEAEIDDAP